MGRPLGGPESDTSTDALVARVGWLLRDRGYAEDAIDDVADAIRAAIESTARGEPS